MPIPYDKYFEWLKNESGVEPKIVTITEKSVIVPKEIMESEYKGLEKLAGKDLIVGAGKTYNPHCETAEFLEDESKTLDMLHKWDVIVFEKPKEGIEVLKDRGITLPVVARLLSSGSGVDRYGHFADKHFNVTYTINAKKYLI